MPATSHPEHPDALLELQRAVQHKLGGCLLRLQQYELLLKAIVAHTEIAGPAAQLASIREEQIAGARKKTLGGLVSMLTEGYLSKAEAEAVEESEPDVSSDQGIWFSMRYRMELDAERYETTKAELRELVDLRNELVHHLLQRFDLGELGACSAALAYLNQSREIIDAHYLTLREWAEHIDKVRAMAASFMQSPSYTDLLFDGISPDGSVDWPGCGIVRSLRRAEDALGQAGWTELNSAIAWQKEHAPEQAPKRYGCSSWRQVLHESRQFEVKKQLPTEAASATNATVIYYRSHREE